MVYLPSFCLSTSFFPSFWMNTCLDLRMIKLLRRSESSSHFLDCSNGAVFWLFVELFGSKDTSLQLNESEEPLFFFSWFKKCIGSSVWLCCLSCLVSLSIDVSASCMLTCVAALKCSGENGLFFWGEKWEFVVLSQWCALAESSPWLIRELFSSSHPER